MPASVCTGNGFVVTARAKTPRMTTKDSEALSIRISKDERAMLDELVEAKRQELAPLGATTSLAQYVRGWIRSTHAAMKRQAAPAPAATPPATVPTPAAPAAPKEATPAAVLRRWEASKRTGADLARATGINTAVLSRFRSGKKSMSAENLKRLAVELDR